jgi:hypothetical protein
MPTQVHFRNFNVDDRKTYYTWMRRTTLTYVALILFGLGMVSVLVSMKAGSVAEFDAGAIGMAAP